LIGSRRDGFSGLVVSSDEFSQLLDSTFSLAREFVTKAGYNESEIPVGLRDSDHTLMPQIFHPLLALIASTTDWELAKYIQFLKEENKILRARLPVEIHTRPSERERLVKFGKVLGRAIEELISIVSPGTFCHRSLKPRKKSSHYPPPTDRGAIPRWRTDQIVPSESSVIRKLLGFLANHSPLIVHSQFATHPEYLWKENENHKSLSLNGLERTAKFGRSVSDGILLCRTTSETFQSSA